MKKIFLACLLLALFGTLSPTLARADDSTPTPPPDPVTITLDVETSSATLFDKTITVSPCPVSPGSATSTVNGFCALEQSGLTNVWTWYGDDAFLDSTGGVANNDATSAYWTWFSNLALGPVALNKHELSSDETLLITIGAMPLKLDVSNASPQMNATTTITVSQFSFDADFNAVWSPGVGSTVHIGPYTFTPDAGGVVSFVATTTDAFDVYATENSFLSSAHTTLQATPDPSLTPPQASGGGGGSGGGGSAVAPPSGDPATALTFLIQKQQSDGSFGGSLESDWAAIALSSAKGTDASLNALLPYITNSNQPSSITDYERRAMALEAANINPYSSTYHPIEKIISAFDGNQIGDPSLLNDDIFALLPLTHAGYGTDDTLIQKEVRLILSEQNTDGSWGGIDLTSAAVQALVPLSNIDGVSQSLAKAKTYLKSQEDSDGCLGNVYSTSWAIQAIVALGDSPLSWTVWGGSTPVSCLALFQLSDGGFGLITATDASRVWATAYAIPALEGKTWNDILQTFPKQTSTTTEESGGVATSSMSSVTTTLANTSLAVATSTTPITPKIKYTVKSEVAIKKMAVAAHPPLPSENTDQLASVAAASPATLSTVENYTLSLVSKIMSFFHL